MLSPHLCYHSDEFFCSETIYVTEYYVNVVTTLANHVGYPDERTVEIDSTYQVIKQANEIKSMPTRVMAPAEPPRKPYHPTSVSRIGSSLNVTSPPVVSNSGLLFTKRVFKKFRPNFGVFRIAFCFIFATFSGPTYFIFVHPSIFHFSSILVFFVHRRLFCVRLVVFEFVYVLVHHNRNPPSPPKERRFLFHLSRFSQKFRRKKRSFCICTINKGCF